MATEETPVPPPADASGDGLAGTLPINRIPRIGDDSPATPAAVPPSERTIEMFSGGPPSTAPSLESLATLAGPAAARLLNAARSAAPGGHGALPAPDRATPLLAPKVTFSAGTRPKLRVLRGLKINAEYPLYEGPNFMGRRDERPVDVDLEEQEPSDRVWSSRQHAVITFENGELTIEDLNSLNGTFVNRNRVYPGQKRMLALNDIIQIGTIQLKVTV